jgi:catechol 2,3-dioxygenase-like lactoylglutathione lyase family enzyme
MKNGISGIDHTIVGVRDLEAARSTWERLGFATTARGRHIGWGTANYCIMFERDYVELLGIVDPAQFSNDLESFLARREGLMGLAFASADNVAAADALRRIGLHPSEPRDLARQLELPEGTVLPRFKLVFLPGEETPGLSAFLCQHLTPDLLRRPPWLTHANGAVGLASLTTIVADASGLRDAYERLFGPASVNTTDAVVTVHAGTHRLVFAEPDDFAALHPELDVDPAGALPQIACMAVRVRDLAATADHLASWQVESEMHGNSIMVPPHEASGVALEFVPS